MISYYLSRTHSSPRGCCQYELEPQTSPGQEPLPFPCIFVVQMISKIQQRLLEISMIQTISEKLLGISKPAFDIQLHHNGGWAEVRFLVRLRRKSKNRTRNIFTASELQTTCIVHCTQCILRWSNLLFATTLLMNSAILICRTVDTEVSSSASVAQSPSIKVPPCPDQQVINIFWRYFQFNTKCKNLICLGFPKLKM